MDKELTRREVARLISELAFARPDDAVRLALDPEGGAEGLDLRLVTEIKRGRDGAVELKLLDREELIKLLLELTGPEESDAARSLYGALDDAARKLSEGENAL